MNDVDSTGRGQSIIGLEVHAQLLSQSKMFCGCSAQYAAAAPNSHVCPVCSGMPGSLPVVNRRAVEMGMAIALALHCNVAPVSKFDRKNYSYPDIPKGYQISQYDNPLGSGGYLDYVVDGKLLRCGIVRVHLEEDTGKSTHTTVEERPVTLIDYNRSGVPLVEIVTEPEIPSPVAAREFFAALRQTLMYLEVNDGNLQEGSMRADLNVSLRGANGQLGTKVEIKNLNSFRAVQHSLEYEIDRQARVLRSNGTITQETRGWSEKDEMTVGQRSKEFAHDYRYFPEPDIPPLRIDAMLVERIRAALPEFRRERAERLVSQHRLPATTADVLTQERPLADFYEAVVDASPELAAEAAKWVTGEVLRLLNEGVEARRSIPVPPVELAVLLTMVNTGELSNTAGKQALEEMFSTGESAAEVVKRLDLRQIDDEAALERLVQDVLASNPKLVDTYRAGKTNVLQAIVGKVMGASKGKANPLVAGTIAVRLLEN